MMEIDWDSVKTEQDATDVGLAVLQSAGLSGGVFSFTPIGKLPSGIPGLLKRAMPMNFEETALQDWFQYQNDIEGQTSVKLSQSYDPVRRRMIQQILPKHFIMEDFLKPGQRPRNRVSVAWIKALIGYGVRESISIPIHTARGEYWSLAAMRYHDNPTTGPLDQSTLSELYWLTARLADVCANTLNWRASQEDALKRPLSPRELDCLYWAGQGKTAAETAELLSIGAETVRKYLKTSITKLQAANTTHAVCVAHRMGYVSLS